MLDHSEAAIVIAQDQEQVDKILSVRDRLPKLAHLLYDEPRGLNDYDEPGLEALSAVAAKGRAALADPAVARDLDRRIDAGRGSDPSVILYTSGTTGRSKGVVLSGERSIRAARHTVAFDRLTDRDEALAYLPLAWVGDHYLNYAQGYVAGFCIACPESAETAANDLREIGPTYHFAPPRVFEALLTRVQIRMEDASAVKRWLYRVFMDVAKRWGERIANGEPVPVERATGLSPRRSPDLRPAQERARILARSRGLHRGRSDRRRPLRLLPFHRPQSEAALRPDGGFPVRDRPDRSRRAFRRCRAAGAERRVAHRRERRSAVQVARHVRGLLPRGRQDARDDDGRRLRQDGRRRLLRSGRPAQDHRPRQGRRPPPQTGRCSLPSTSRTS